MSKFFFQWLLCSLLSSASSLASEDLLDQAHLLMKPNIYTGIDAMLVYQHDELLAEYYYGDFGANVTHRTHSTFKSINALITLIAVDQGLIGLEEGILPLLKSYAVPPNVSFEQVKVIHLLNMVSGLDCNEAWLQWSQS